MRTEIRVRRGNGTSYPVYRRGDSLAPSWVRFALYLRRDGGGIRREDGCGDLVWVDVERACVDHSVDPAVQSQVALLIDGRNVAQ
jgi:hypothetical protein